MMRIFVNYLRYSRYQHNTDVRYLKNFEAFDGQECQIVFNESRLSALIADIATRLTLTRLAKIPVVFALLTWIGRHTLIFPWQLYGIDLIVSFWFFPVRVSHNHIPLHFASGFLSNTYAGALSDAERTAEVSQLSRWYSQATLISYPAHSWITRFRAHNNRFDDKIVFLPFFLPDIRRIDQKALERKFSSNAKVKLVFVGRDGKLKGLTELLNALSHISNQYPELAARLVVTIISETEVDAIPGVCIHHHSFMPHLQTMQIMRESHIFCLPTQRDSYGFVFIEAMGSGCAIIADDQDPRPEILNHGECGILTDTTPLQISKAIVNLASNLDLAYSYACKALNRFDTVYSPHAVKLQYVFQFECLVKSRGMVGNNINAREHT